MTEEPRSPDETAVHATVQRYVDASGAADIEGLRSVFHENALMSGYMMGELRTGSIEPFLDRLGSATPPNDADMAYAGKITSVVVAGKVATATLKENGFLGMDFTNFFHLMKVEGGWKIIAKTYHVED